MLDQSVHGSDHPFGFISKIHGHIIGIDMDPDFHLPPPPFGSFVQCRVVDEIIIGIVFNAKIKNITIRPDDPSQSPAVVMAESKRSRVQLVAELHAAMIGSMMIGTGHFRHHFYQNPTVGEPVFPINESTLNRFAFNFSYFKTLIHLQSYFPFDDLLITQIRKFSGYYPDRDQYTEFIYKELNTLFDYDKNKVNGIIDQSGIHVKVRT
jgi:hypothetical protein